MADSAIRDVVKEHLGLFELSKTQVTLLATIEKFTEANKEQVIKEFLRKMNQISMAMPEAGRIQLLRMKVADAISLSITSSVQEGKDYQGICDTLIRRY